MVGKSQTLVCLKGPMDGAEIEDDDTLGPTLRATICPRTARYKNGTSFLYYDWARRPGEASLVVVYKRLGNRYHHDTTEPFFG